ncbi:hypothetical protein [Caballeronia sp. GACF4]|uniref:hypothetical protein n=1 Tax=Caballeronia sp. GACF4 TaxID=2921763 RepID=UPI0020279747|nr:hypothetical protein [Caballeronia sp. GACF4]
METSGVFSLERFESCINGEDFDEALALFGKFSERLARFPYMNLADLMSHGDARAFANRSESDEHFASRVCHALGSMLVNPRFTWTDVRLQSLQAQRSLIWSIAAATSPGHTDHFVRELLARRQGNADASTLSADTARRLSILYSPESRIDLDIAQLWNADRASALSLAIGIGGKQFGGSAVACARRIRLLEWLTGSIDKLSESPPLDLTSLWALYMHCTYTEGNRHAVKQGINGLVRLGLANFGLTDLDTTKPPPERERNAHPLMLVVAESFNSGHSIVRTHSATLAAARRCFETVAFCAPRSIDDAGRRVFDRTIDLPEGANVLDQVRLIRDFAQTEHPSVLYMPSVGMSVLTIFLSNIRVAPLQIAALGHPATTHSNCIDYVSVEDDYVGDPACFSEKLMRLPKDGQPYIASSLLSAVPARTPVGKNHTDIAIAATPMKLNPSFFTACRAIVQRAEPQVHLHFIASGSKVFTLMHLNRVLTEYLPSGSFTIHGFLPYEEYAEQLANMDMFLSPFPFGNTNGIVDAFTVGLPGICKTGPEVFEHIDGAMFARASMPEWMVATTVDDYVEAAVRLANNRDEREALRAWMLETKVVQRFFEGRPEVFGEMALALLEQRDA